MPELDSFMKEPDIQRFDALLEETRKNSEYFNSTYKSIVAQFSKPLDELMQDIYADCIKVQNPSLEVLERYYMELQNMLYFMNEQLEQIGIQYDMAEKAATEVFSKGYIKASEDRDSNGKKRPVDGIKALANRGSQYEGVVASVFDHAYKVVRGKMASGQDQCDCLRRIISTRTEAMKIDAYQGESN